MPKTKDDGILRFGEELDDDQLLEFVARARSEDRSWWLEIRDRRKVAYRQYSGDSRTDEETEFQKTNKLNPLVSVNLSAGTVNAILGESASQMLETKVLGLSDEMADLIGDWLTRIDRAVMRKCNGRHEELEALFDLVVGGAGFTETHVDQSYRPARVVTRHVQPWEWFVDANAVRPNFEDATRVFRERSMTVEQAQARWPKHADKIDELLMANGLALVSPRLADGSPSGPPSSGHRSLVRVVHFVYSRYVPYVEYEDPEMGVLRVPRSEFEARNSELQSLYAQEVRSMLEQAEIEATAVLAAGGIPQPPPEPAAPPVLEPTAEYPHRCWYAVWLIAGQSKGDGGAAGKGTKAAFILDRKKLPISFSPFQGCSGLQIKHFDRERVSHYGIMEIVRDLQRYLEKALSSYLETIARGAKGGVDYEESAMPTGVNETNWVRKMSIPGQAVKWADGAISEGRMQPRQVQSVPTGLERIFDLLMGLFPSTTGITDYVKGTAQQERSNVLISNLQERSIRMLEPLVRQFHRMQVTNARLRLQVALLHLPPEVINSMVGDVHEEGEGLLWEMQTNPQTGQPERKELRTPYDVLKMVDLDEVNVDVEIGDASPYAKSAVWSVLEQGVMKAMFDALGAAGVSAIPLLKTIVRALPLPGAQAIQLSHELEQEAERTQAMQQVQGIVEAALQQGPDGAAQVVQAIIQALQQNQPGGQPPGQAQPQAN